MRSMDMEYETVIKNYEQMVLAQGLVEIRNPGEVIKERKINLAIQTG